MAHGALISVFSAALPADANVATGDDDLRARIDAGRAAWPDLPLEDDVFVRHVASHSAPSLPSLAYAADLWLACACATGCDGAVAAFEREHGIVVERAIARVSRAVLDDVKQAVMVSLFVAEPGRRPRIAEYGGRAALRTWLATVAVNAARNRVQHRDNRAYDSVDERLAASGMGMGPELVLAKARHGEALDAAFRDALIALDKRKRVILRLHHVQGWTVDRLATMYRVSRSAAGRLVVDARTTLLDDIKRRLGERLTLTPPELDSLLADLQSNVQISLVRMLDDP